MLNSELQFEMQSIASNLSTSIGPTESNLPSLRSVVDIACDLRDLIFPGFHQRRPSSAAAQESEDTWHLQSIATRLRTEIARALGTQADGPRLHHSHHDTAMDLTQQFLRQLPEIQRTLIDDVSAAFDGDPAAKTPAEIVLCYPGIQAIMIHRLAHCLYSLQIPCLPRMLSEWSHSETGIDIHPGAQIGPRFFIDHGTGVVIGETCVIGKGVTLYQGVTLGAWSFPRDEFGNLIRNQKRHPTLDDGVTVYSNASILGGDTVIGTESLIGSGVTLSRSVPPRTIVTIEKPSLRFREAG